MSELGTIALAASASRKGREVEVLLTADIPPGTHVESHEPAEPFLIPTVVEVEDLGRVSVEYPPPVQKDLGLSDVVLFVYEGAVTFVVRGEAAVGLTRVRGTIRYQPCVGGACLPPRTSAWEAVVGE